MQTRAEIVGATPVGAYLQFDLAAPEVADRFRPGQFVTVAVGGPDTALVLRRSFALADAVDGIIRFVVAERGLGTRWLVGRRKGDVLDLVGPLGTPFPPDTGAAVLVGGGYGTAPLVGLGRRLSAAESAVSFVVGAATAGRLCSVEDVEAIGAVSVTTDDGSVGVRGVVTDVLASEIDRTDARVIYACGPMAMLRAVGMVATTRNLPAYVAVEEAMACGIGVCMTCAVPIYGDDGASRFVRSCVDGPVFRADRIRWDAIGRLPADLVGADVMG